MNTREMARKLHCHAVCFFRGSNRSFEVVPLVLSRLPNATVPSCGDSSALEPWAKCEYGLLPNHSGGTSVVIWHQGRHFDLRPHPRSKWICQVLSQRSDRAVGQSPRPDCYERLGDETGFSPNTRNRQCESTCEAPHKQGDRRYRGNQSQNATNHRI